MGLFMTIQVRKLTGSRTDSTQQLHLNERHQLIVSSIIGRDAIVYFKGKNGFQLERDGSVVQVYFITQT